MEEKKTMYDKLSDKQFVTRWRSMLLRAIVFFLPLAYFLSFGDGFTFLIAFESRTTGLVLVSIAGWAIALYDSGVVAKFHAETEEESYIEALKENRKIKQELNEIEPHKLRKANNYYNKKDFDAYKSEIGEMLEYRYENKIRRKEIKGKKVDKLQRKLNAIKNDDFSLSFIRRFLFKPIDLNKILNSEAKTKKVSLRGHKSVSYNPRTDGLFRSSLFQLFKSYGIGFGVGGALLMSEPIKFILLFYLYFVIMVTLTLITNYDSVRKKIKHVETNVLFRQTKFLEKIRDFKEEVKEDAVVGKAKKSEKDVSVLPKEGKGVQKIIENGGQQIRG